MRSGIGNSAGDPLFVSDVSVGGAPVSASNPLQTQPAPLVAGTDRSGSITTGGAAQQVAAGNTSRRALDFQNTSDTEMRVTENGTAATATTGYQVLAGGRFSARTNRAISVFCATTGKTFAATEI
jgi:hypothetical protein